MMAQRSRDLVKRADLAARDGGNLQSPERDAEMRDLIKAQIMPHRTDKNGNDLGPATDAETDLMLAEAASMGLSILAGQAKPIRFEKGGPATLQPTWIGLVKQAQDTGEFGGIECILYTDGTRTTVTDSWGNARVDYVWQDGWDDPEVAPIACKVGIWRKGAPRPSWGLAHYSTWGTEPDPDGWHDKIGEDGQPVRRKKRGSNEYYKVREHNGKRVPKASDWWKMPRAIHMLAVAALRLALKATFQPDLFRRATMSAATELGLDRDERLEVAQQITGRPVETFSELDPSEYTEVYDALVARGRADVVAADVVGDEVSGVPGPAPSPAATAPDDDPQDLKALRRLVGEEYRRLSSLSASEWRPWFRKNVNELREGAWEDFPRSLGRPELEELLRRIDELSPREKTKQ